MSENLGYEDTEFKTNVKIISKFKIKKCINTKESKYIVFELF